MGAGLRLDRAEGRLCDDRCRIFDGARRVWVAAECGNSAEPIDLLAAVRWLQRDSATPCRVPIAVIGPREAGPEEREAAYALGAGLAALGLVLLCGGKSGVMEAACEGTSRSGGLSIGLLPDAEWEAANPFVTVPIATGIGVARNALIARAALAMVAVGGG